MIHKRLVYYKIISMLNEEYYPYYLNKSDALTLPPFESIVSDIINSCIEINANVIDVQKLKKNYYRQELKELWVSNELKDTRDTKDSFYYEINRKAKAIFNLPRINSNILVDLYSTEDYRTLLTAEIDKLYNWQNDINSLFIRYPFINSLSSQNYIDAIKNDIEFLSLNFIASNKTLHLIPDDVIDHFDQGNFNEIIALFYTDVCLVNYDEKIRLENFTYNEDTFDLNLFLEFFDETDRIIIGYLLDVQGVSDGLTHTISLKSIIRHLDKVPDKMGYLNIIKRLVNLKNFYIKNTTPKYKYASPFEIFYCLKFNLVENKDPVIESTSVTYAMNPYFLKHII
ncbi:hypothetical protein [Sporosarcina obsidiansis]|uniref:hypothetical protein n=1 Tax=Sporosarcina obsidiansis TaxID=2660748 RepID=UPI00129BF3C9|nr:hypothetical protein [Sporosarcina obsidiansis]